MKRLFALAVLTAFAFPFIAFAKDVPEAQKGGPEAVPENALPGPPPADADRPMPPEGDEDFRPGPPPEEDGDFRGPRGPREGNNFDRPRGDFRGPGPRFDFLKFENFDTNKDGVIDKEEFKKLQEMFRRPPMPPQGDFRGPRGPREGGDMNPDRPQPAKKGDFKKGSQKDTKKKAPKEGKKTLQKNLKNKENTLAET